MTEVLMVEILVPLFQLSNDSIPSERWGRSVEVAGVLSFQVEKWAVDFEPWSIVEAHMMLGDVAVVDCPAKSKYALKRNINEFSSDLERW